MTDLSNRSIPGITAKIAITVIVSVAGFVGLYLELRSTGRNAYQQSLENNQLLREFQAEIKQDRRLDDAKIQSIELQIRECKVRLDILERDISATYENNLK